MFLFNVNIDIRRMASIVATVHTGLKCRIFRSQNLWPKGEKYIDFYHVSILIIIMNHILRLPMKIIYNTLVSKLEFHGQKNKK